VQHEKTTGYVTHHATVELQPAFDGSVVIKDLIFNQGQGQIQDLPGVDHGEHGARAYNGGLGSEPPAGSRGRASAGVSFAPLKFCPLSYKRGDKG